MVSCVLPIAITSAKDVNHSSVAITVTVSDSTAMPQYKASYGVTIYTKVLLPNQRLFRRSPSMRWFRYRFLKSTSKLRGFFIFTEDHKEHNTETDYDMGADLRNYRLPKIIIEERLPAITK